nr:hypothetical protein [Tanacetum cinerariifolium]
MGFYKQNSLQSKFDQASRISKSVFVSNFPEGCTPRDLWKVCNDYGTVVDVFIPNKKSKAGKRFSFVRFIKVINLDRPIENLNTIWIFRFHLFANHVRFKRPKKLVFPTYKDMPAAPNNSTGFKQPKAQDHAGSYVNVVNGSSIAAIPGLYISSASALVLDDSCVVERDLSKYAMGKVKDVDTKVNMMQQIRVKSWFHVIQDEVHAFVSDEHIVWVDIEWIPLNVWSRETFMRIGKKWGETLDIEDNVDSSFGRKPHSPFSEEVSGDDSESDVEEVSETIFGDNSSSPNNNSDEMGFTPEVSDIRKENNQGAEEFSSLVNAKVMNNSQEVCQEMNRESVDPNVVKEGGTVLGVLEDMIRVGHAMGYTMDGCVKDFERIIGTQEADDVPR